MVQPEVMVIDTARLPVAVPACACAAPAQKLRSVIAASDPTERNVGERTVKDWKFVRMIVCSPREPLARCCGISDLLYVSD
jgi:hypothetical protein